MWPFFTILSQNHLALSLPAVSDQHQLLWLSMNFDSPSADIHLPQPEEHA